MTICLLAYLDQGSGSYVFQTLAAGFFSIGYLLKRALGSLAFLASFSRRRGG